MHRDSLSNKRYRERCFRNLLSDQKEEDSLSQEDGDGHGYLLSSRWKESQNKTEQEKLKKKKSKQNEKTKMQDGRK